MYERKAEIRYKYNYNTGELFLVLRIVSGGMYLRETEVRSVCQCISNPIHSALTDERDIVLSKRVTLLGPSGLSMAIKMMGAHLRTHGITSTFESTKSPHLRRVA